MECIAATEDRQSFQASSEVLDALDVLEAKLESDAVNWLNLSADLGATRYRPPSLLSWTSSLMAWSSALVLGVVGVNALIFASFPLEVTPEAGVSVLQVRAVLLGVGFSTLGGSFGLLFRDGLMAAIQLFHRPPSFSHYEESLARELSKVGADGSSKRQIKTLAKAQALAMHLTWKEYVKRDGGGDSIWSPQELNQFLTDFLGAYRRFFMRFQGNIAPEPSFREKLFLGHCQSKLVKVLRN